MASLAFEASWVFNAAAREARASSSGGPDGLAGEGRSRQLGVRRLRGELAGPVAPARAMNLVVSTSMRDSLSKALLDIVPARS